MSTKNLARTVIEGGRARYNKFERYHSNAVERSHAHQLERELCRLDPLDDSHFAPRKPVYQGFDDKLGPARRFLRSQVGRPWSKVRSELFERFDRRTTAGRHILFDHLLAEVNEHPEATPRFGRQSEFIVTNHGILRYQGRQRWASYRDRPRLPESERVLRDWLGAHRVAVHGARLYWLVLTARGGFRQARELTAQEATRFQSLPGWFRESFEGALAAPASTR